MKALSAMAAMVACTSAAWCAGELELRAKRVVVFKNGYALVIKEGKAIADEGGEVHTTQVPETAVLGTSRRSAR